MATFTIYSMDAQHLIQRTYDAFDTVQECLAHIASRYPYRQPIAWDSDSTMPQSQFEKYTRCMAAIANGAILVPDAYERLVQWARTQPWFKEESIVADLQAMAVVATAPKATGKPRAVLVQEWMDRVTSTTEGRRKLAEDAWAATRDMCKGSGS